MRSQRSHNTFFAYLRLLLTWKVLVWLKMFSKEIPIIWKQLSLICRWRQGEGKVKAMNLQSLIALVLNIFGWSVFGPWAFGNMNFYLGQMSGSKWPNRWVINFCLAQFPLAHGGPRGFNPMSVNFCWDNIQTNYWPSNLQSHEAVVLFWSKHVIFD